MTICSLELVYGRPLKTRESMDIRNPLNVLWETYGSHLSCRWTPLLTLLESMLFLGL